MARRDDSARWWEDGAKGRRHSRINAIRDAGRDQASGRRSDNEHHLRLYSTSEWRSVYGSPRDRAISRARGRKLTRNVVRNVINAYVSMMCRSRQHLNFMTDGADWRLRRRAKNKERYVLAIIRMDDGHGLKQRMIKNAGIFGSGYIFVARDYQRKRPVLERVAPGEISVDDFEAMRGEPRSFYRERAIDRDVLKGMCADEKDADRLWKLIDDAPSARGYGLADTAGHVVLREAWHLRSYAGADDGRYVATIENADLWETEYQWDAPPWIKYDHEPEPHGYEGCGLAAELAPIQLEINTVLRTLQENHWHGGNLKVFVERGAGVARAQISNDLHVPIIEYAGAPPVMTANDIASPQLFQYLQDLESSAYQVAGISQLNAQSQTPGATMSGRARLAADRNESQRFLAAVRRLDTAWEQLGLRVMEAAEDVYAAVGDAEIMHHGSNRVIPMSLADVCDGDEAEARMFDVQVWTSSLAHKEPAAQIEYVESLIAAGFAKPGDAYKIIDVPDARHLADSRLSAEAQIEHAISRILDDGEWVAPVPEMDLALARDMVLSELSTQALVMHSPSDHVDMLRDFYSQVVDLMDAATPDSTADANDTVRTGTESAGSGSQPIQGPLPDVVPPPLVGEAPAIPEVAA